MSALPRTDEALLAATGSDAAAFGEFYRRHAAAVLAYLLHRTRDPERALDLTAEVFVRALEGSGRYRASRGPARAWLFGIARHVMIDSHRGRAAAERARRRLGLEPLSFEDSEIERTEALIDLGRMQPPVLALVGDLPEEQRAAVLARIVDEREYGEIAAEHGVTEQTVRQRVSRGLARLSQWSRGDQHV
jgi:RNA polymerase sigma factor (sigma-70 family)